MLTDGRQVDRGARLEADVCIVGAGAAGITLARELRASGLRVLLLESGGFEPDEPTQALAGGEVVGEPLTHYWDDEEVVETRLRYFGGTTNHWAGFCRPLEPVDFVARPAVGQPGWPITYESMQPWYERAAELCALHTAEFDVGWWVRERGGTEPLLDDDVVTTSVFQVNYPYSFGTEHRDELVTAPDVELCLWANVVDLPLTPGTDAVDHLEVATLDGNRFEARARAYVLATGGIENARILLAADRDRPDGLGNEHDLVGRYFAEHLQVLAGFAVLERPVDALGFYTGVVAPAPTPRDPEHTITARAVLTLTSEAVEANDLLGLEAQLLVTPLELGGPGYEGGIDARTVERLAAQVDGPAPPWSIAYLQVVAEQQANPESRIRLSPTRRDALGLPVAEVEWRHTELDRRSIVRGLELIGERLGAAGLGRLQLAPGAVVENPDADPGANPLSLYRVAASGPDLDSFPLGIGYHHLCTTRMSNDPTQGVVDPDGRVHSVDNLWIAGSSTFATGGTATPTFTIVALAARLADHLRTVLA